MTEPISQNAPPPWFHQGMEAKPTSRTITVAGCPIHYLTWGDRTKPGLLLLHGKIAHAQWFTFMAPHLMDEYYVVAPDLSGMGESGHRKSYSIDLYTDEILEVMDDAGMFSHAVKPAIAGHSFSGRVALRTGFREGRRLSGVIMIDTLRLPSFWSESRTEHLQSRVRPHKIYDGLDAALARFRLTPEEPGTPSAVFDYIARHSTGPHKDSHEGTHEGGWTWKFDPKIMISEEAPESQEDMLMGLPCPKAAIFGEHSHLAPRQVLPYLDEVTAGTMPATVIPNCGHHLVLSQPLALTAAIKAYLSLWRSA